MPLEVFKDSRLSKTELRVLGILLTFMRPPRKMYCYPKRETISSLCNGLDVNKISTATTRLVKLGWLVKEGNGGKSCSSRYHFKVPAITTAFSDTDSVTVTAIVGGKKEINKDIYIVNDFIKDFDRFWNAYPRKSNKKEAIRAWKNLSPNQQLIEQIIAVVKISVTENPQWIQQGGKFIPYPAKYLNDRRWEDELPTSKSERIKHNHASEKENNNAINQSQPRTRRDHASLIGNALNEIIINEFGYEVGNDDISTF